MEDLSEFLVKGVAELGLEGPEQARHPLRLLLDLLMLDDTIGERTLPLSIFST